MKVCNKCNKNLSDDSFSVKPNGQLNWMCKECNREYQREHYRKNKSYYRMKARDREQTIDEWYYTLLCNSKCVDCGIDGPPEVLEFDHIDPTTKTKSISEMVGSAYGMESIKAELIKCECRCANCHKIKTARQFGWYKNLVQNRERRMPLAKDGPISENQPVLCCNGE